MPKSFREFECDFARHTRAEPCPEGSAADWWSSVLKASLALALVTDNVSAVEPGESEGAGKF